MTNIEWTEATWNPIVGCSVVSPGCTNCYAMKMAGRLEAMDVEHYQGLTIETKAGAVWTGDFSEAPNHIWAAPLKRKKPTMYFVNSMGDLFHESVPKAWIDRVFAVMALCPQHTFQVLTKRAARMEKYVKGMTWAEADGQPEFYVNLKLAARTVGATLQQCADVVNSSWPLPNVWLGVSAENQAQANERLPDLLTTPAALRFVSVEPMLGALNLEAWLDRPDDADEGLPEWLIADRIKLCWVIGGGESGPDSRPMHPDWVRSLRDQCKAADVPFFFKQWGDWAVTLDRDAHDPDWRADYSKFDRSNRHQVLNLEGGQGFHGERVHIMKRVGKKNAGRWLDGMRHDEMPTLAHEVLG